MDQRTKMTRRTWPAWLLLISAISGCGTSEYNALINRGAARLRGQAKFQGMYLPTVIPGTQFSVRVPVIFTQSYTKDSGHPDDGDRIKPDRRQPPFMPADDTIKLTYEGMAKDPEGKTLPFYCYLAVGDAKPGDADKLANEVEAGLKKVLPEPVPTWEPVDADTPSGKAIHWRKIRMELSQPFFVKVNGKVEKQTMPGIFELWMYDAGEHLVLVGWRAPKAIEGPQTDEFTVVNGTSVPADNAKPDLSKWPILTAGSLESEQAE